MDDYLISLESKPEPGDTLFDILAALAAFVFVAGAGAVLTGVFG